MNYMEAMSKLETALKNVGIEDRLTIIKVGYGLEVVKSEVIKILILAALFFLLGYLREYIFTTVLLFPLRHFSGGAHMRTNIGCFIFSLAFFMLSIVILPLSLLPEHALLIFLAASSVMIAIFSPVASHKRPITADTNRNALKRNALVFLALEITVLIILWRLAILDYFIVGAWVITLQSLQLVTTWAFRRLKKKGEEKNVTEDQKMEAGTIGNSGG